MSGKRRKRRTPFARGAAATRVATTIGSSIIAATPSEDLANLLLESLLREQSTTRPKT